MRMLTLFWLQPWREAECWGHHGRPPHPAPAPAQGAGHHLHSPGADRRRHRIFRINNQRWEWEDLKIGTMREIGNRRPWKHFLFTSPRTSPLERWRPGRRGGRGAAREWSLQMKLINSLELWKSGVKTLINSSLKAKLHSVAISSFYLPQIIACDPRFQKIQFS